MPYGRPDVGLLLSSSLILLTPFTQVYQRILQIDHEPPQFDVSFGLLLRDDLHHAFDRLEWSFYYKVSEASLALCKRPQLKALRLNQMSLVHRMV